MESSSGLSMCQYTGSKEKLNLSVVQVAESMMPAEEFLGGWAEVVVGGMGGSDEVVGFAMGVGEFSVIVAD